MYPVGKLARGLQVLLVLEAMWAGLLPLLLCYAGVLSGIEALAWTLGLYLGARALVVSKNFYSAYRHRSPARPEHRVAGLSALRLWWGEFWITAVTYSYLFPFESNVPEAPAPAAPGNGTPIVLVPGFACNRGYWRFFIRFLAKQGFGPVYAVTLEPVFGSIEANAGLLAQKVEAICKATGAPKVILIGHSMGGLTIRAWLHHGGVKRIAGIITLGSPHHGTAIARDVKLLGENLREMCPGSEWGAALNAHEAQPCPVPITAIVSPQDNIVFPQNSALLRYPNARNRIMPGIGHLEMIASRPVMQAVAAELRGA